MRTLTKILVILDNTSLETIQTISILYMKLYDLILFIHYRFLQF